MKELSAKWATEIENILTAYQGNGINLIEIACRE